MKVVIAMMKHETNTFSPIVTDWSRFEQWGAYFGEDAKKAYERTGMPMAAYIDKAKEIGAEILTPVAAEAMPSGRVTRDAYQKMVDAICSDIRTGCDAVFLDLHGAMVTETTVDGEGTLLEAIRSIAPELPIAVTCDFHCNLTRKMIDHCTALIGYKTYPHVDMYQVGSQIANILTKSMEGFYHPVMVGRKLPLLTHTLKQGTDDQPMRDIISACREAEKEEGVLAATFFGGFPMADIPDAGASVVVVTNDDIVKAEDVSLRISELGWQRRKDFVYQPVSLQETLEEAKKLENHPVVLLDHEDNCGSGGTQDVMMVIREIIENGLEDVAVAAVYDPQAVEEMEKAGVGSRMKLSLGGKIDMPSVSLKGEPLEIEGRVRTITDGRWTVQGPMYTGVNVNMGKTAVFDTGKVQIVVVSLHHEPWDIGVFTSVGIQPQYKKYLLLKSRIHYRAGFGPLAKNTLLCDGEGVTTSMNDRLDYKKVNRPIFPLDETTNYP